MTFCFEKLVQTYSASEQGNVWIQAIAKHGHDQNWLIRIRYVWMVAKPKFFSMPKSLTAVTVSMAWGSQIINSFSIINNIVNMGLIFR